MAYLIQGETLTGIANQARRLTGASGQMSPAQIATALSGVSPGGGSANLDDYVKVNGWSVNITMPSRTGLDNYAFSDCAILDSAYFSRCTSVGIGAFENCENFRRLTLNSACSIDVYAFGNVLAPDSKTFRLYLRGNSMGTCSDTAFDIWEEGTSDYTSIYDLYDGTIPGLEIYVPASLLNGFKTTWAGGAFANNIYALTD